MPVWSYMENGGTRCVVVAHRRWGKDDVALHFTSCAAHQRIGNYWHMLPKYEHARIAIWDAINPHTGKLRVDEAFPEAIRKKSNQQEMKIDFRCGSTWQLVGSDNYNKFVGAPPIGIVFSEWALADPKAWAFIRPIIEENGGWVMFVFSSRGNNHGKAIYEFAKSQPGWFAEFVTADTSPVFSAPQLKRIQQEMIAELGDPGTGLALFNQEYNCSFEGAVPGAYFARQMTAAQSEGRITEVPWQPGVEVDTFWDLGVDDSMTIWFLQHIGQQYRFLDYYENSLFGLEHYAKVLKEKPYVYGNHYMPHDAAVREMSSGEIARTRQEVAEALGIKPVLVVERAKNMDVIVNVHIPAIRNILPACWFDSKNCERGIAALGGYRAEYDDKKKKLGNRPVHDQWSHGADGFRTFVTGYHKEESNQAIKKYLNKVL